MSDISFIPDSWVLWLILIKGVIALIAVITVLINMVSIWKRTPLVISQSRRQRMWALLGASAVIAVSSSRQMTQLDDGRQQFSFGYEQLGSIAVCVMIIVAMVTTRREDIAEVPPDRS